MHSLHVYVWSMLLSGMHIKPITSLHYLVMWSNHACVLRRLTSGTRPGWNQRAVLVLDITSALALARGSSTFVHRRTADVTRWRHTTEADDVELGAAGPADDDVTANDVTASVSGVGVGVGCVASGRGGWRIRGGCRSATAAVCGVRCQSADIDELLTTGVWWGGRWGAVTATAGVTSTAGDCVLWSTPAPAATWTTTAETGWAAKAPC